MLRLAHIFVRNTFAAARVSYEFSFLVLAILFILLYKFHPGLALATTLCPTRGKEIIVDRIMGNGAEPKYIHWGTGAGAIAAGSVGLSSPSADEARVAGTGSKVTVTTANDAYQVVGTITCASSGKTITNAALFDDATAGNLFVGIDSLSQALNVGDGIAFTFRNKFVSA